MPASTTQFPTNNPRVDGPGTPRVNYIELGNTPTHHVLGACVSARVTAAIAKGKHPVPSRTRKLSLSAPMVLQPRGCGRVGRRRTTIPIRAIPSGVALIAFVRVPAPCRVHRLPGCRAFHSDVAGRGALSV